MHGSLHMVNYDFKFTNPGSATNLLVFSKNAVVLIKDKSAYLSIRVGEVSRRIIGKALSFQLKKH